MYKKITIALTLLSVAALIFLAYKYYDVSEYKLIANEKINYLTKAADDFCLYGFIICGVIWLWVNVVAIKTKQLYWLWIPFLFSCFVAYKISYHAENIFVFTKQNGMWKGGFSLSFFAGIIMVLIAVLILLINYFVLKMINKKNAPTS